MFESQDGGFTWKKLKDPKLEYESIYDMSDPRLGPLYLSGDGPLLKEKVSPQF